MTTRNDDRCAERVTVALTASELALLDQQVRRRRMATGEAVTRSSLVRELLTVSIPNNR